ncbi:response regulator containing CheY-like receiver domain and AraC-type DNA-binding domain [Desulfosporosinus acidiphilus SJ4]|uniref:Stage 0 sporulation protein A homolog n=1 Tax=Desulfosporosinus acidiphilus (strain DSM 22704 / JCM 16185 / SJ4) TaxID=646529 RepID=I4D4G3_DESAJ|nr:response regulator [Desulfosporosinus acidiphilus]AFM40687.1 response regulator containing CheY-like receiver domain and AraC-type DNA-binding domain [Desulfosporosinus acidiphilus SJ4]
MKRLLIVDDAAFMRLSIRNMLLNYDIEIVGEATNGIMAVEMYKQLRPDVVTMDITMPEMTGIEALKEIKAFDPKALVIMVSSMGQESMVKQSILSGAKTFIVKPFTEDVLYQTLSKTLGI